MLTNNMHSVFTLTNYTGPLGPLLATKSVTPGPLLATKSDPPGPLLALTLGNQKWTWEDTHELLKPHENRCLSEGVKELEFTTSTKSSRSNTYCACCIDIAPPLAAKTGPLGQLLVAKSGPEGHFLLGPHLA